LIFFVTYCTRGNSVFVSHTNALKCHIRHKIYTECHLGKEIFLSVI
jgi:hypothetical protein